MIVLLIFGIVCLMLDPKVGLPLFCGFLIGSLVVALEGAIRRD